MTRRHRVLAGLFLLVGGANLVRGVLAFVVAPVLEGWSLSLPLPALGVLYLLWGIGLGALGVLWWGGPPKSRILTGSLITAAIYETSLWMIRLLFYRASYARNLWARDLVLTVIFLVLVFELSGMRASILKRRNKPPQA